MSKYYTLKPQVTPLPGHGAADNAHATGAAAGTSAKTSAADQPKNDPFIRAEAEDDDGYDPYSDRKPAPEPMFERDPWG